MAGRRGLLPAAGDHISGPRSSRAAHTLPLLGAALQLGTYTRRARSPRPPVTEASQPASQPGAGAAGGALRTSSTQQAPVRPRGMHAAAASAVASPRLQPRRPPRALGGRCVCVLWRAPRSPTLPLAPTLSPLAAAAISFLPAGPCCSARRVGAEVSRRRAAAPWAGVELRRRQGGGWWWLWWASWSRRRRSFAPPRLGN